MTVLEKIKRCVSLVWDFQEIYGEEDIEDFCHNELSTYPQHDEIMGYFKHTEELEKENAELKAEIQNLEGIKLAQGTALNNEYIIEEQLQKENADLKEQNRKLLESCAGATMIYKDLCKAKAIIKKFLLWENDWHSKTESKYELLKQAEQLLKEEHDEV